jgi:uncharacterized repeat protein (TIGR02543 family)
MKQVLSILLMLVVISGVYSVFCSCWLNEAEAGTVQALVPKTGQTSCWDVNGNSVVCTGTGQDGDRLKGVAWPTPRFTDNTNGTVTDNLTGLIWLKNANCFDLQDWATSLNYSNTLASGYCDLADSSVAGDWRMPNYEELRSLIDLQSYNPALPPGNPFTNVQSSNYWSSTSDFLSTETATILNVYDGALSYQNKTVFSHYIWPVRSGQSFGFGSLSFYPNFGSVIVNSTSSAQILNLSNGGIGNLTVSAITITGSYSSMFSLNVGNGTAGTCGATPTIAQAGNCTVSVTFTPTSTGVKSTMLKIASNDITTPNIDIALTGTGILPHQHTVTYNGNNNTGGTVPNDSVSYPSGATVMVLGNSGTLTKTGYTFAGWNTAANGSGIPQEVSSIFNMASTNVTLYAQWTAVVPVTYAVTPSAGAGSNMTPATAQTVNSGTATSFTIAPVAGYGILSVSGCNGTLSGTIYTTGAITANCAVSVTSIKRNANGGTAADPTIADALKSLQAYTGAISLTAAEKLRYDVAPLAANGVPQGNGVIDIADVILTLRRSVGIGSW